MLGLGPRLHLIIIQPDGGQLREVARLLEARALHAPRIARAFPLDHARRGGGRAELSACVMQQEGANRAAAP